MSTNNTTLLQQKLPQYSRTLLGGFRTIAHAFVSFNALFGTLILLEIIGTLASFPLFGRSAWMALCLSAFFLTSFSYLVLSFYYCSQKPEQFFHLKDQFIQSCRQTVGSEGEEVPLSLAKPLADLAEYLQNFEGQFYQSPGWLQPIMSRLSVLFYRRDVFQMKQLLLQGVLQEQIRQIRHRPTEPELHAALAHGYTQLADLYQNFLPFTRNVRRKKELTHQFQAAIAGAIEEFRILNDYAPNDPWIHQQMASGYRTLKQSDREIQALEILRTLCPEDTETLSRLGILYFELGQASQGLRMYEKLRAVNLKKAEELITFYGQQTLPFSTLEPTRN